MGLYLITGGAGFIGSHLADRLLSQGHHVKVFDNLYSGFKSNLQPQVEFINGDITNINELKYALANVDGCFHLAAIASIDICEEDWAMAHTVNALGTLNIFRAIKQFYHGKIPVIFSSSAAIYGIPCQLPLMEKDNSNPISNYGLDKLYGEQVAKLYANQYSIRTACLRFFNVYGERQQPNSLYSGVISKFIAQVRKSQVINIYGDGTQTRDFISVGDVVDCLTKIMSYIHSQSIIKYIVANVGTGKTTTINKLAELIAGETAVDIKYFSEKENDIKHSCADNNFLKKLIGKVEFKSLSQELKILKE